MRHSPLTDSQILAILKQSEQGFSVPMGAMSIGLVQPGFISSSSDLTAWMRQ